VEADLLALAAGCPSLTILDLEHNRGWVTERGLVALAAGCPQLQIVDLSDCDGGATDAVLDALGSRCGASLKFLGVSGCAAVGSGALARLARRCPQLHELHAGRCAAVDDSVLRALAVGCPRLRLLNINDGGGGVSEPALRALVAGCPALRSLLAASCAAGVTDGLLRALAQRLPGLESLCVSACTAGVTEGALLELAAGCKQLRYLDVSYNPLVTDKAVQAVAGSCSKVRARRAHAPFARHRSRDARAPPAAGVAARQPVRPRDHARPAGRSAEGACAMRCARSCSVARLGSPLAAG